MRRKTKRLVLISGALGVAGIAAGLTLFALRDSVVFFYGPTEFAEKAPRARNPAAHRRSRRDGLAGPCRRCHGPFRRHRQRPRRARELYRDPAGPVPRGAGGRGRGHRDGAGPVRRRFGAGQARRELHAARGRRRLEEERSVAAGRRHRCRVAHRRPRLGIGPPPCRRSAEASRMFDENRPFRPGAGPGPPPWCSPPCRCGVRFAAT